MSTTHLDATITTLYSTILTATGLTPAFAAKVIARLAERVELMYDETEREAFVSRTQQLMADHGYAVDVAAQMAAREIVDDGLLEMARAKGGGWDALYGETDDETVDTNRPDYRRGVAGDLVVGDGLRLVDFFHAYAAPDLDRPLVVTKVTPHRDHPTLIYVDIIDRASMVHEAMGNLPDGVAETVATLVFNLEDRVLIRR